MSDHPQPKKKILPKPGKRQSLREALEATNKQYGETLARLAREDESEKKYTLDELKQLIRDRGTDRESD